MKTSISLRNIELDFPTRDVTSLNLRAFGLRVLGLRRTASESKQIPALSAVNLDILEGERVGLLGTNGSGKTTLLKVIAGVLFPTQGTIDITGSVSSIFDPALGMDQEASGIENIFIRCMLMGFSKSEAQEKTDDVAAFSELGEAINRPIKTYSAGMAMRLAFSIATTIAPEILVLDEWLSAGDARFVSKARQKMEQLIQTSRILVIASHSEQVLTEWCSRVIWLRDGRVYLDGEPGDVLSRYREYVTS